MAGSVPSGLEGVTFFVKEGMDIWCSAAVNL